MERGRRNLLLLGPAALAAGAQFPERPAEPRDQKPVDVRLPNGKRQTDEILKVERETNLKEAHELTLAATAFEEELEKTDRFVLSLGLLKKLDDVERLAKRIRARIRK